MSTNNNKKLRKNQADSEAEDHAVSLTPQERAEVDATGAVLEPHLEADPDWMKIDLHCHSEASQDCVTPFERIPGRCRDQGVKVQAITDHNSIWGAEKVRDMVEAEGKDQDELVVVIGEEITTSEGELIGLFLKEPVERGLTPEETVAKIKSQGGVVMLPHGFDPLKRWRLRPEARERIADQIDIVETFNARVSRQRWNQEAVIWSRAHDVPMSAGSDAHTLQDIGSAWVEVPAKSIQDSQDLLEALEGGVPVGKWTHPILAYILKLWYRLRQNL